MSDVGDDDLLNDEEFDYEDYDITNEKEAALLQDEESNHLPEHEENSEKKGSEDDNEDDVLDIDLEEELDDTDDKNNQSTENRQYRKFSSEKSSTVSPNVTNSAPAKVTTSQNVKKNVPNSNKQIPTINKPKPHSNVPPKFVRRRGVGSGRGNFQTRPTFARNTSQRGRQERRNGKVYINPKYEGIVPINETNGRLAWDNPNFPQPNSTQTIQPWLGNATLELNFADPTSLISNLLAINSAQSAMQMQPQIKNTFEPPPQVAQGYQHTNLTFQPPTQTAPMQPYDTHNQVTGRPFGSQMPGLLPTPQQFNSQPVNRMQDYNNYYNRQQTDYGYGTNRPDNFKTSNYSKPVDFAVKSFNYGNYLNKNYGNDFQSKAYNSTYSGDVANKNSTYGNVSFQNRNLPSTSNFAKPYINPGKQGDYSKNQNLTGKTGDYNRDHLAYPQKSGDYKSNENQTYNTPRNQNLNYYAKPQNYNTSARPDSYQNLNYNKRWEVPKSNYDQNQIFTRRPKPNYDTRSNNSGDMNYTEESFDNTNLKSNNTQNQNYNRNVSNYNRPNNQSVSNEVVDIKIELPNKKIKMEEESEKKSEAKQQPAPADNKVVFEEEDDEETRLYRLKIEEQKKERERILKMKEERRKQALLEAEKEERRKQALLEVKNRQNVMLAAQKLDTQPKMAPKPNYQKRNYHQQMSNNIPVLSTETTVDSSPDKLSNFTFNVQNDLQKSAAASQKTESVSFMSNRVVLVKNSQKSASSYSSNVVKTVPVTEGCSKPDDVGQNLSSFFNNRKVLKKDNSLPSTRLVVINNLATSTNENKIVAMTKGIGEIQTLRMDKQERQATILFKTVASAHAFFKKYQRHMLDLSMIEVKLENLI